MSGEIEFSRRKSLAYAATILASFLLVVELGTRFVGFIVYNFSPYYLLYGFIDADIDDPEEGHTATFDGYFKFPASRVLHQYGLFADPTPIRINNLGFRGEDFDPSKPDGTLRVVCMGGSSTFGFYNRDGHTYPDYLLAELRERSPNGNFDVLNAGIPHMNSQHIAAMLRHEILGYQPDVVTLYSAYNDAVQIKDQTRLQAFSRWLHGHVATYVALKRVVSALGGPILYSKYSTYLPRADTEYVASQVDLHVPTYEANVREFVRLIRSVGATPVFIRQPMTTRHGAGDASWVPAPGLDYDGEVRWFRDHLDRHGWVPSAGVTLLVHAALIETLERVAREERVVLVDQTALLGDRNDLFASYVHLSEPANEILAKELAEQILRFEP